MAYVTLLLVLVASLAAADPAPRADLLEGKAYEDRLHALLDGATTSVDAVIYLVHLPAEAKPGQPVRRIIDHLAATHRRGVVVRVLFDAGTPPSDKPTERPNRPAAEALRAHGVDVRWDEDDRVTHAKAVVVDGRHCLVGSGNWTASALRTNRELNVYLDSPAIADQFAAVFTAAWAAATPVR